MTIRIFLAWSFLSCYQFAHFYNRHETFFFINNSLLTCSSIESLFNTLQGRRKVWISGGASSNVVGIICSSWSSIIWGYKIVSPDLRRSWGADYAHNITTGTPGTSGSDRPAINIFLFLPYLLTYIGNAKVFLMVTR